MTRLGTSSARLLRRTRHRLHKNHSIEALHGNGREISSFATPLVHYDDYKQRQKQQHRPFFIGVNIIPVNESMLLSPNQSIRYSSSSSNMSTISSHHHDDNNDRDHEEEMKQRRKRTVQKIKESSAKIKPAAKKGASLLQQYGPVFIGTYFSIYFATLGSLWAGITYDVIDVDSIFYYLNKIGWHSAPASDAAGTVMEGGAEVAGGGGGSSAETEEANQAVKYVVSLLEKYDFTRPYAEMAAKNSNVVNLGIAWVATKLTEPVRFGFTALILPKVARAVGRVPSTLEEEVVDKAEESMKVNFSKDDEEEKVEKVEKEEESFEMREGKLNEAMKKEEQELMKR